MNSVVRDLVEYVGLADYIPMDINNVNNFQLDDTITLSKEKPDIKQICKVSVDTYLKKGRIVKSATGNALNGDTSKGFKFIGEVVAKWRIEYVTSNNTDTIYSLNGESLITAFVSMPFDCRLTSSIISTALIDDINVQLLSCRTFMLNITGILIIENN